LRDGERHIEADNVVILCELSRSKEVAMASGRNLIIAVIVVVVLIAAYFLIRGYQSGPESIPASTTEPKK
jgi:hypothetical protein